MRKLYAAKAQPPIQQYPQQMPPQLYSPGKLPLHNYNLSSIHPSIQEPINPKYVESYHEPIPKN